VRAVAIDCSSRSVAKICRLGGASRVRACSASRIAIEYASSPVAQAGHPDPHRVDLRLVVEQLGDQCLERLEAAGVAKEVGDADQQVLQQRSGLAG
jgi:hypothetical protein